MPTPFRSALALGLLLPAALLPAAATAAGIRKCTMPDGRVTYSDGGCTAASRTSQAYMPPPSGSGSGALAGQRMHAYAMFHRREQDRQARDAAGVRPQPKARPSP